MYDHNAAADDDDDVAFGETQCQEEVVEGGAWAVGGGGSVRVER